MSGPDTRTAARRPVTLAGRRPGCVAGDRLGSSQTRALRHHELAKRAARDAEAQM